ncbi:MAG: methyltransferase domain-containing protein [Vicinamibacteria bacterium]
MAATCPVDLDTRRLRDEVGSLYARVATEPSGPFHFHRGAKYAVERLGYDPHDVGSLPELATESFAGVGNPLRIEPLQPGETVLDVGCGGGMDLLLAARQVGERGRAIGVDMTPEMLERAGAAARAAALSQVELHRGEAQSIPIPSEAADTVISNGVLNLTPDKIEAFAEIVRVLRPGGRLLLADIVVESELSEGIRRNTDLWTG